ncbi:MAG TPA: hypothetical protein VHC44_02355 [Verrucomicrobiae bacterium]|nr:hypothetical protein [Verrucomicrobiae bacterium]
MEIEFNPGRVPKMEPSQTVARPSASAAAGESSFPASSALMDKLKNQSDVRPEQVARAKGLVSDVKYPPDDVLDRIAVLLAINVKD